MVCQIFVCQIFVCHIFCHIFTYKNEQSYNSASRVAHHFFMQRHQYLVVSDIQHTVVTLLPRWFCLCGLSCILGLTKLAKNAYVCKNQTLGLIHQDPYDPRYMAVYQTHKIKECSVPITTMEGNRSDQQSLIM